MNSKRSLSVVPLQIDAGLRDECDCGQRLLSYSMFSSFPVCVRSGKWGIVQGLPIDDFRARRLMRR
jgi:hypothetical protein